MTSSISSSVDADGIRTITWDMPNSPINKVNEQNIGEFEANLKKAVEDKGVKGIIIASAKDDFIVGADLTMLKGMRERPVDEVFGEVMKFHQLLRYMETCGKPVVAALTGSVFGAGLEIALACHYRIVSDQPKLKLGFPEVKVGILPGAGGTQRFPRLVKLQEALQIMTDGRNFGSEEALKLGAVHAVVSGNQVLAEAKKYIINSGSAEQPWDQKGFRLPSGEVHSPKGAETFSAANALMRKITHGNYPGPIAIVECVYHGLQLDIMEGCTFEARKFVKVLRSDTASNMIRTMFFSMNDANKLKDRPSGYPRHKVDKLGILGAGLMGSGIAYASASSGIDVVLIDSTQELADKGKASVQKIVEKQVAKGQLLPERAKQIIDRVNATVDYESLQDCSLLIEAVFEDRDVKAEVTKRAESVLAPDAVIASNTSTIPITLLGEVVKKQDKFIGIHFFSPVEKMPLVEIIRSKKTSDECVARALDYVQQIKKTPIVVNDSRGFYTSRCFATYTSEGIAMLAEGIPAPMIENIGRMAGMPMGPLEVADMVGLDVMYKVTEQTRKDLSGDLREDPSFAIIKTLVKDLQRLGQKNGKGFYDHGEKGQKKLWEGLKERYPNAKALPTVEEIKDRLLMIQAVETVRCLEERVVLKPADADIGSVLGWGFCPFYGGVVSYIDTIGSKVLYEKVSTFAEKFGERFAPPKLLKDLASQNRKFYAHAWQAEKEQVPAGKV
jgi:3-hydroxyacyl-CoA dehydrogenase / enoyl-CoA hydratase / 3-hydroxybutyryl-CoA epimerase